MSQDNAQITRRFKHIFLDAEGTLYVPRRNRTPWEFWADPTPEAAIEFFELDAGVREALEALRVRADTLCVVSRNPPEILFALLNKFRIRHFFDEVILNGDKGKKILSYLNRRGLPRREALMVGDLPRLDLYPVRRAGVEAILVSRSYNEGVDAERIGGLSELPLWLKMADLAEEVGTPRAYVASLDDFQTAAELEKSARLHRAFTKRLIEVQGA